MSNKMRRQHWVDSHVQGTLIRRILFHWCSFFVATLMSVSVMQMLLGDPNLTLMERIMQPSAGLILIGLIALTLFPAFALDTIRFSNRFVGPIARLRRSMRELAAGQEVRELKFRSDDFWGEVADEFNLLADRVRQQAAEIESLKQGTQEENTVSAS